MMYSKLSIQLTKSTKAITKQVKKNEGIFFTPPSTIQSNLNNIEPYFDSIKTVLEPSCGSCEYITALHDKYPDLSITGIEHNETIYDSIKDLANKQINIIHGDYLAVPNTTKYDLIIGNPPYFVMKKDDLDEQYYSYFEGRPNIFIPFIIKSLNQL